ncbi:MAG: hypothetical protein JSV98_01035 [candidate division WOR-3 bacterium]|nr:MAG: hypothetical protein JSV98_01035 [candidate division WOR-3 bacterium]
MSTLFKTGSHLFRYRAALAAIAFVILVIAADPRHSLAGHAAVLLGLGIRIWAAGYIGSGARRRKFHAEYIVRDGPYRVLKHPLYFGNLFLVSGILLLYKPPRWLGLLYLALFVVIYGSIIVSEIDYLKGKPARETCYKLCNLRGESSTWLTVGFVYLVLFVLLKI